MNLAMSQAANNTNQPNTAVEWDAPPKSVAPRPLPLRYPAFNSCTFQSMHIQNAFTLADGRLAFCVTSPFRAWGGCFKVGGLFGL